MRSHSSFRIILQSQIQNNMSYVLGIDGGSSIT